MKNNIFIEVTLTNNCNCNCLYCFEGERVYQQRNINIEKKQLELIIDACKNFDKEKYSAIIISFWGGEPFLNTEFMFDLIKYTYEYDFVKYHCYSNGLLIDKYKELLSQDFFNSIRERIHIQLSYDGEPHHTIKRGNTGDKVLETAQFLVDNNVYFAFKSTLSYDMIDKLPEIWESYKNVVDKFKTENVTYFPTLDTVTNPTTENFDNWKRVIVKIAKKEFNYFLENNRLVWQWFNNGRKMNCNLENSIHMHNDGNIYICHGCPYLNNSDRFVVNNINKINSLYDVLSNKFSMELDEKCVKCEATHCSACHVTQLKDNEDIYKNWSSCRSNNENKCKYYKYFGYIARLLKIAILKQNKV